MITEEFHVKVTYGSEFQWEVWQSALLATLQTFEKMMASKHKKNSFTIIPCKKNETH